MSKGFNYSKWDNIELSDDEDDVHPNIERESWFRMKHRSRIEREEKEEIDKKKINTEITSTKLRMKEIEQLIEKLSKLKNEDTDDSDDELEDEEGLRAELEELRKKNEGYEKKVTDYEKNKKWNVDNICHVVDERTIVNPKATEVAYSNKGFLLPNDDKEDTKEENSKKSTKKSSNVQPSEENEAKIQTVQKQALPAEEPDVILSYPNFVEKYANVLEEWMTIRDFDKCKDFLLLHGNVLLQENASNYLLLASLEDEMNGHHDKMRLTARQSQILSNIAELAKSLNRHPGSVILPFFSRLHQKEFLQGFLEGVEGNFFLKFLSYSILCHFLKVLLIK